MPHLSIERSVSIVRQAARSLGRSPGYCAAVILSLALGLGLNTSLFAIVNAVLRRPLPYPSAERLVSIGKATKRAGVASSQTSWQMFDNDIGAWRAGTRTLESFAVVSSSSRIVAGNASPEYVEGAATSLDLPSVLGIQPMHGRWFSADESASRVVVISEELWQRHFARDPSVVGKVLRIQGDPWTVIGILPRGLGLPLSAQYWIPGDGTSGEIVARLRQGASADQAARELALLSPGVANLRRAGYTAEMIVTPLHEQLFGAARAPLLLVSGAAALLLLIACVNIANLSLARTLERRRELTVRRMLGASRWSLAALVFVENVLLGIAGAALGTLLAAWCTGLAVAIGPDEITRVRGIDVGATDGLFAGIVAMGIALVVSVGPIVSLSRSNVQFSLNQSGSHTSRGRASQRVRRTLVATQLALALVLITGAGLLIRTVVRLTNVDHLGFSPDGVTIISLRLNTTRYRDPARRDELIRELTSRVRAMPAVTHVGAGPAPLVGGRGDGVRDGFNSIVAFRDPSDERAPATTVWVKHVDPGYLETYRIALRAGRSLHSSDDRTAPPVAIVNAAAARLFFPDRDAIGQSLQTALRLKAPVRVVGIADDVLQRDLTMQAVPEILLPIEQQPVTSTTQTIAVRSSESPVSVVRALREILRAVDPELAAARLEPMDAVVDASLARHTFLLVLLSVFAALALVLSALGLYAVVSYLVAQRTAEIGIRFAFGAQRRHVFGLVLGEGVVVSLAGVAIGIPAALALSRFLTHFVYEIRPHDLLTFAAAPIGLMAVSIVAAFVPAWRASRVDPVMALRSD